MSTAEEFILIPKNQFMGEQPYTSQILVIPVFSIPVLNFPFKFVCDQMKTLKKSTKKF